MRMTAPTWPTSRPAYRAKLRKPRLQETATCRVAPQGSRRLIALSSMSAGRVVPGT